jgi:geranylgeranyl diphosphate synthase type I
MEETAELAQRVETVLTQYIDERTTAAEDVEVHFASALESLSGFVLSGGKRIRPAFAWWGWVGAGGDPDSAEATAVLSAVSALELIQTSALVHDDLIDASAVRRGSPTVHTAFADEHRAREWHGDAERFGLAAAVLLGDVALAWADDMLYSAGLPADVLRRAAPAWQAMRTEMLAGQYLDVLTQVRGDESVSAAVRIDQLKTAAYTVERPLHFGAELAGAGSAVIDAYREFGANLGVAFQLRDDLLGVFGDPEVTGKPAGDDLREGKRTLLVALGIEAATTAGREDAAQTLRAAIGNPDLTAADVTATGELLADLGAVDAVEGRIEKLTAAAMEALHSTEIVEPARTRLAEMAVNATRRDR